jgi:hypothetical protein
MCDIETIEYDTYFWYSRYPRMVSLFTVSYVLYSAYLTVSAVLRIQKKF